MLDGAPRRLLRRSLAATYCGVSERAFDAMVKDGTLPKPRRLGAVKARDRLDLDAVIDGLPEDGVPAGNEWDAA